MPLLGRAAREPLLEIPPRGVKQVTRGLGTMDRDIFEAVARAHSPLLDWLMPKLTRAADHSVLWAGLAVAMSRSERRPLKRAAARGIGSVAVASLVTNQLFKRVRRRPRPIVDTIPLVRRAMRLPTSNSFPSGHSASAAAFAIGAGFESPSAGLLLSGLAGLVGFSRVATGAHFPGDVVAGFGIGAAVAVVGARIVPPIRPPVVIPRDALQVELTPRPDGDGLVVVVNPGSGGGTGARVVEEIRELLPAAEMVELKAGDDLEAVVTDAALRGEVLGVAGGDGTVACAAKVAIAHDVPLAVFPAGTFNHFARAIETPTVAASAEAVRSGAAARIDVARLNDALFLNTSSVGAYPDFVHTRERLEHKVTKPLAAAYALWRTLHRGDVTRVKIDNREMDIALMFIGNGRYQPQGFAPAYRPHLDDGLLDVRMLEAARRFGRFRLVLALATGRLGRSRLYHEFAAPRLGVQIVGGARRVALDGELDGRAEDQLEFAVDYRALTVHQPVASRR